MNAIDFLIKEHNKVRQVLADISDGSHRDTTKRKLFESLSHDLIRHETMEETVWYPRFKNDEKLDVRVKHLISEEKIAEKAIKKFDNIKTQQEWEKMFVKFKRDVEHHADEEEKKLFPNVRKILDENKLEEIGKQMREFKEKYKDS